MDSSYLITAIVSLAGVIGVLSGAIVHLWRNQLSVSCETIKRLEANIQKLEEKVSLLESREQKLESQIADLKAENSQLRTQYFVLASSQGSSPLPMWIKDSNGVILQANKAYEQHYLRPLGKTLQDYIGKTDADVWPERVVTVFKQHDQQVLVTRQTMDLIEPVTNGDGVDVPTRVIKWPRFANGIDEPFGISGVAIPDEVA